LGFSWLRGRQAGFGSKRAADIAKRKEAATLALNANAVPLGELNHQMGTVRARLAAVESQIDVEAVATLAGELDAEMAAIGAAADELNAALARVMGLRAFTLQRGSNYAFSRLAAKITELRTPEIGSTRGETADAAAEWERRFEELAR
jgi:hypothetical protein